MNDSVNIRIFIQGLKNTQSLAARSYEKDLQTLKVAITEVDKLNAAQQPTTRIILFSIFNMVTNEEN